MFGKKKKNQQLFHEECVRLATIADKHGVFGDTSHTKDKENTINHFVSLVEGQAEKNAPLELELTFPDTGVRIVFMKTGYGTFSFLTSVYPHKKKNPEMNYYRLGQELNGREIKSVSL